MPAWHHAGHLGMRDWSSLRYQHNCLSYPPPHLSYFQTYCAPFVLLLWAHQISQNLTAAPTLRQQQFDKACFKRSVLLFVENNSSQSRAELEPQRLGKKLPRDWERGGWMEIFLETVLGHGPDIIICKHTHICTVVTDLFLLPPAGILSRGKYSEPELGRC